MSNLKTWETMPAAIEYNSKMYWSKLKYWNKLLLHPLNNSSHFLFWKNFNLPVRVKSIYNFGNTFKFLHLLLYIWSWGRDKALKTKKHRWLFHNLKEKFNVSYTGLTLSCNNTYRFDQFYLDWAVYRGKVKNSKAS